MSWHLYCSISIHALREESDDDLRIHGFGHHISIHALREESDARLGADDAVLGISIHALREESDIFFFKNQTFIL